MLLNKYYEISRYSQDKHPELHIHENYEIFISLSNEGKFFVREKGYQLRMGSIFILKPFEIHRCFCHGNSNYDRYVLHVTANFLEKISTVLTNFVETFNNSPLLINVEYNELLSILNYLSIVEKETSEEFGSDYERNMAFGNVMLKIARLIRNKEKVLEPPVTYEKRVNDVLDFINKNYSQNISLDSISKELFISRSRLSQLFKEYTGFSIGDYIITYRIQRACTLLSDGIPVYEVSKLVGFNNNANFIRTFKKHTGYPPGKFIKNNQN